ncbi:MAG: hypothetical protein GY949_06145 [Gammaproteobacteria bacterium]|nr:hypothetical protein [Gammaproteobacteria bacterium]
MKYLLAFLSVLVLSPSLHAEEQIKSVGYFEDPLTISAVPGEQRHVLFELTEPGITSPVYALKGMVRYTGVEGDGFLQMDSHFGEMGTFFTKSLAASGALGKISGNSDWRPFVLPFNTSGGSQSDGGVPVPEALTLTLNLPGSGTVSIRDVKLHQYASGEDPMQSAGQWLSNRSAGLIGGIGGGLLGLWGALIGVLASRGKARVFVLGSANAMLFIGVAALIGGVVALVTAQPYAVYYPLLLIGVIVVFVIGKLRGTLSARYEEIELKRMQSMDA